MENAALRRAPVWTAMAAIVAASWWALTTMSGGTMTYGAATMGGAAAMNAAATPSAGSISATIGALAAALGPAFAMWSIMMVAMMQAMLALALLLDPMMRSASAGLRAAILAVAGAYQLTPTKSARLSKCRTPLSFFMANWRDGVRGALAVC